jgi:O-methyltransferase involved in polyketide biosynthesis
MNETRDYSSISPSAKSLLLMKSYTNIPYAKEAATLMQGPEVFDLNFDNKDFYFWIRVMHFESRYWSIDQLLQEINPENILELSSGYSLRGLDRCTKEAVHYVDTDLPEVIAVKQKMIQQLRPGKALKGKLELLPLNALNAAAFNKIADLFTNGPVTIVNEGLLMYLSMNEKKQLCKTIHSLLTKRGGYWITADIYAKLPSDIRDAIPKSSSEAAFHEQHRIEDNKFESYKAAETFFNEQGFEIVKEASIDFKTLSVIPHLLQVLPPEARNSKNAPPKIQVTWLLKVK